MPLRLGRREADRSASPVASDRVGRLLAVALGLAAVSGTLLVAAVTAGASQSETGRLLGFDKVRNYDGSWTEWGNLVGVPIER